MKESKTRAELIDPALKAAGWGVVEGVVSGGNSRLPWGVSMDTARRSRPDGNQCMQTRDLLDNCQQRILGLSR